MNHKSNEDIQEGIKLLDFKFNKIGTKMLNNVILNALNTIILCWGVGALLNLPTNLYS